MSSWRPVRRLLTRTELEIEAAVLQSAGIPTFLPDRDWFSLYPSLELGSSHGYRIYVLNEDLQSARLVLNERAADFTPSFPCPACGGKTRRLRRVLAILALCILRDSFAPFPFYRRKRICMSCKTRYLPKRPAPFSETELAQL